MKSGQRDGLSKLLLCGSKRRLVQSRTNDGPADMPHADAVESLSKRFGTGVKIRTNGRGAGQISIKFKDNLEFERIRELLEK